MAADMGKLARYIEDDPANWKSYAHLHLGTLLSFGENLMNSTYITRCTNLSEDWTLLQNMHTLNITDP